MAKKSPKSQKTVKKSTPTKKAVTAKKVVSKKVASNKKGASPKKTVAIKKVASVKKATTVKKAMPAKKVTVAKKSASVKKASPAKKVTPIKKAAPSKKQVSAKKIVTTKKAAVKKGVITKKTSPSKGSKNKTTLVAKKSTNQSIKGKGMPSKKVVKNEPKNVKKSSASSKKKDVKKAAPKSKVSAKKVAVKPVVSKVQVKKSTVKTKPETKKVVAVKEKQAKALPIAKVKEEKKKVSIETKVKADKPKNLKEKKASKKANDEETEIVLSEDDKAILAEAEQLTKTKKEPKIRKEPFSDGPIDGKPRLFKIGIAAKPVEKKVANPIHIASEMPKEQTIYVPIASPEYNNGGNTEQKFEPKQTKAENDAVKKSSSVESKLRNIYTLQLIDSKIDRLKISRADLPRQINSVKLEVESLNSENTSFLTNAGELQMRIGAFKEVIKGAENSIKDFKKQLSKTKGTEKDYIEKEIEFQELEIELQKKHIRLAEQDLKECNKEIASLAAKIKERESDLKMKEKMLSKLISETEAEENALLTKLNDQRKRIDSHLLERYDRLRKSTTNGLAVVPVERDASTGSFIQIPTQIKMNVQARKRIMTDEHSGRILVDDILAREEEHFLNLSLKKLKK